MCMYIYIYIYMYMRMCMSVCASFNAFSKKIGEFTDVMLY